MEKQKLYYIFLIALFILGFFVRLYRFSNPIADWHSWRQADTSAVSRNFVTGGVDVLHPKFDDLSNVPSGLENPQGYRFVEFPLYNVLQAESFMLLPFLTLEEWGRVISILASLISALFIYLLMRKQAGEKIAFFSTFFFLFTPYNIYYSRVILPDPSMVTATLGATYFFSEYITLSSGKTNRRKRLSLFILATFCMVGALLLKPYAAFFTLPLLYLIFQQYGFSLFKKVPLYVFAFLSLIPLALWRIWISHFPEGIPAFTWLFNGNGIRFRPAFFRWMGYERLTKLISGYTGIFLLIGGVLQAVTLKKTGFLFASLLSALLYVTILATGNVQHDYYQILIMPAVAICMGFGAAYILSLFKKSERLGYICLGILIASSFYFGWKQVKDYFNINNPSLMIAGAIVDAKTPKDAKIIAPYNGDTSFLYQTKRKGWASFEHDVPTMKKLGASYIILVNPTAADLSGLGSQYHVIASSSAYLLLQL